MVGRKLDRSQLGRLFAELLPADLPSSALARGRNRTVEHRHAHGHELVSEGAAEGGRLVRQVEDPAGVPVAVWDEQHLRRDLAEPVDHARCAELGGAARPDRAQAGCGEEADDRRQPVRQDRRHPVAAAHAETAKAAGGGSDHDPQLTVGGFAPRACVVDGDDRQTLGGVLEQLVHVVELRPCKESPRPSAPSPRSQIVAGCREALMPAQAHTADQNPSRSVTDQDHSAS